MPNGIETYKSKASSDAMMKAAAEGKSQEEIQAAGKEAAQKAEKNYQEGLNNVTGRKHPIPEDEQKAYAQAYAEARANGADKKEAAAAGEKAIKKRKELKVNAKKAAEAAKKAQERIKKQKQEQQDREDMAPSEESRQQSLVAGASMGPNYNTTDANAQGVSDESNSTIEKEKLAFNIYYGIDDPEAKTGERQMEVIKQFISILSYGGQAIGMPAFATELGFEIADRKPAKSYKEAWENLSDELAKFMLSLVYTTPFEEAGEKVTFDGKLGDNCYVKCQNLKITDATFDFDYDKENIKKEIKKKLDEGLNALYISIKDQTPCDCFLQIGGDHYLKDLVYAACSVFCDTANNRKRNKKTYKKGTVNFANEAAGTLIRHVKKTWKPKFDELRDKKGFTFKLNYVCLNNCIKVEARPRQAEEYGWDAFKKHIEENALDLTISVLEVFDSNPYVNETVQLAKIVKTGSWDDLVVQGYNVLNPFSPEAVAKRNAREQQLTTKDRIDKILNVSHLGLATLSFVPYPAFYVGAPLLDAAIHFGEVAYYIEYEQNRRAAVDHFKACFLDFMFIIPVMKGLQVKKMATLFKKMRQADKTIAHLSEQSSIKARQAQQYRNQSNAIRDTRAQAEVKSETARQLQSDKQGVLDRNASAEERWNNNVNNQGSQPMSEYVESYNNLSKSRQEMANVDVLDAASRQSSIEAGQLTEKAKQMEFIPVEAMDLKAEELMAMSNRYDRVATTLKDHYTTKQWEAFNKYFRGQEVMWVEKYPELFKGFTLTEENGKLFVKLNEEIIAFREIEKRTQFKQFWYNWAMAQRFDYALTPTLSFGSDYSTFFAVNGLAQSAYGTFLSTDKDNKMESAEIIEDIVFDEVECTWGNVISQGFIEAIGDILFMPKDVVAFITSEDSLHYYNVDEMKAYFSKNYGIVEKKTLMQELEESKRNR